MIVANCVIILILFCTFVKSLTNGDLCTTSENEIGKCIPLVECETMRKLLPRARQDVRIRNYLRESQCKVAVTNKPWICCPTNASSNFDNAIVEDRFESIVEIPKVEQGVCGRPFEGVENVNMRIVGGTDVHLGEFPWAALLVYLKSYNKRGYHCGGTLITSKHVITAAHCSDANAIPKSWKLDMVRLGELDLTTNVDCEEINSVYTCGYPPLDVKIERVIIHEQYSAQHQASPSDIGILKLSETVTFTEFIKPICLPFDKSINVLYGTPTVAGFGRTESTDSSQRMLKTEVDIVDHNNCVNKYQSQGRTIFDSQICAMRPNSDACNGDSGGGLIKQDGQSGVWYLIGIVSFGPRKCGSSDFPGVYVNIQKYKDWILNKINNN